MKECKYVQSTWKDAGAWLVISEGQTETEESGKQKQPDHRAQGWTEEASFFAPRYLHPVFPGLGGASVGGLWTSMDT